MTDTRSIVMCQKWAAEMPDEIPNTLVHELIHSYDDARARIDWTNLVHHACTEIRAANLSGDCSFRRELNRSNISPLGISMAGQRCIRRRAQISVLMNPACPSSQVAEAAVDKAWSTCFADTAPFDRVPD
jgi:inner membrane protease ATP23